ncbi:hypothetical protein LPB140_02975 [Sphingorhabdus lutea]|uniref:Isopropylmalate isomerase n=1 Tax=Sphingorhabdus lutea TaxID=1913578 RepID=A0A1L3JA03_9SPHN|nr:hypothetical protein [Sphingorhabdus lutea]APG61960.1 hypothetical protein LPB140_02975 [Sphingorhabdus lutea]
MSKKDDNKADKSWSKGSKIGAAAVGSAALVAALLYAGKKRRKTKPKTASPDEEAAEATKMPRETD